MARLRLFAAVVVICLIAGTGFAAVPELHTASGAVVKANAEVLILRPRGADGRFGKALTLKIRGTSKVSLVSLQKRSGQTVPVQREGEVKDLQPEQVLSVIYTNTGDEYVLLSAVAVPAKEK